MLEQRLTKKRILELYLNVAEWDQGVYGAEAATRHPFGKSARELNVDEAAWLATILPSPLRYDPMYKTTALTRWRQHILRCMHKVSIHASSPTRE